MRRLGGSAQGSGGGGGGGALAKRVFPQGAGMSLGYNVHPDNYYAVFGQTIDMAPSSAFLEGSSSGVTPDYDTGLVTIAPGGQATFHPIREINQTLAGLAGTYVVTWTGAGGCQVSGTDLTVTSTGANRIAFTFDPSAKMLPAALEPHYWNSPLSSVFVQVRLTNPTGSAVTPNWHMFRASHEADFVAGKHFTPEFIWHMQTASEGPIRFMPATNAVGLWVQTPAEIPRDGGYLLNAWHCGTSGQNVVKGERSGAWSPEKCARLCVEAGRTAFLDPWTMCTNATWQAYLERFQAVYPSDWEYIVEVTSNEGWISGKPNTNYLRYTYSSVYGTSMQSGGTEWQNQATNLADFAFRMARVTRDTAGTRALLCAGHQSTNPGWSMWYVARADLYQRWSTNTSIRLGDIMDHHTRGGYIDLPLGWPQIDNGGGEMFTLLKNKAHQNNAFTGGSALTYWTNRYLAAISTFDTQMAAQAADLASQNFASGATFTSIYEGHNHTNVTPGQSYGTGACALGMSFDGTKFVPANVTLTVESAGSQTLSHAGESAAQFFDDGDRAFVNLASDTSTIRRGWLVKNVSGGVQFFASNAAYAANTPTTFPTGLTAWVMNESRLTAFMKVAFEDTWLNNTTVMAAHMDASRARGVKAFTVYALAGDATYYRDLPQHFGFADWKPWYVQSGDCVALAHSALATYIHNRALT